MQSAPLPLSSSATKLRALVELMKLRLSSLVVFSAALSYLLGSRGEMDGFTLFFLLLGGLLVTGSSNTINQIIEVERDRVMKRTRNRPLPTGRLTVQEATFFAMATGITGVLMLATYVNFQTALLTLSSLMLYAFAYTPLKPVSPIAVLVGAIPGAMPPLIGWVAATGTLSVEAWVLFAIQFMWQFPHFWAIAWVLDDDYKQAGFKMLPYNGGRNLQTAFQIMIYTLCLLPLGVLPTQLGITGPTSAIVATVCGSLFLMTTFHLMRDCSAASAKRIMFGSFLYLPIVQITYVLDKIG